MNRIFIYAHYDADGVIRDYVVKMLNSLKELSFKVIFVTTSTLQTMEKQKVANLVETVIEIENIGYDFFSWKTGISSVIDNLHNTDELVLINSSIIGPLFPLKKSFEKMADSSADFWGMTESYETNYHLQSYFIVFRKKIINSTIFKDFWLTLEPLADRQKVINSYELKLTDYFTSHGFKSDSCVKIRDIKRSNLKYWILKFRPRRNPTLFYPFELLKLQMPFVKIQLLRDNPYQINLTMLKKQSALLNQLATEF